MNRDQRDIRVSICETMIILLLVGFLLIGGISLMLLESTIEHAEEGYEDDSGFHLTGPSRLSESNPSDAGVTLWDQVEGACCPLDITPRQR